MIKAPSSSEEGVGGGGGAKRRAGRGTTPLRLGPAAQDQVSSQLQANAALASRLGISGTPGWIVGDRALNGAVGQAAMGEAIEEARQS